jgi:hypothetical protein
MSVLVEAKVIPYVRNKDGTYTSPKDLLFTFIDQIRLKMIEKNEWKKYIQIFKKHFEE